MIYLLSENYISIITAIIVFMFLQIITFIIKNSKTSGAKIDKVVPVEEEQPQDGPTIEPTIMNVKNTLKLNKEKDFELSVPVEQEAHQQPAMNTNLDNSNSEINMSGDSQNLSCSLNSSRPIRVRRKPKRYSNEFIYY